MYAPMFDTDDCPAAFMYGCAADSAPGDAAAPCAAVVASPRRGWYEPAAVPVCAKAASCSGVKPATRGIGAVSYGRLAIAFWLAKRFVA